MALNDKKLLQNISTSPGVYLMKDGSGRAIYIGKAKNLRNRVRSYFHNSAGSQRLQIPFLVKEIEDIDVLITENERNALILENALIKQHKPKFNIMLKDGKNYTSLRLDPNEEVPRLVYTRKIKNDGAVYFGPFSSAAAMRQTKKLIHKIFPIRDCTDAKYKRHRTRPCLNYPMKLCLGPCAGKVDEETYADTVQNAKMFLKGQVNNIVRLLKKNMRKTAAEMRYEVAANYRDQIALLEKNREVERFIAGSLNDRDVFGMHRDGQSVEFEVLFSRGGAVVDKAEFSFTNILWDDREILMEFLTRFYGGDRYVPKEILIPHPIKDKQLIEDWVSELGSKKVKIIHPKKGEKANLVKFATHNAIESYRRKYDKNEKAKELLEGLRAKLTLPKTLVSIECYDISNTQGAEPVASMVRFENAEAVKKKYRKFKIKTVEGPNDYAMMYEALSRRLNRAGQEGWELPELIVVDGGKGQLNIAQRVFSELNISPQVGLVSIAKAREEEDRDKIYRPGSPAPLNFPKNSGELKLLMRIRDEAHRFAITFHKKLRRNKALESELDGIPGIGEKRKQVLINHFGSPQEIAGASVEEISGLPGMTNQNALDIKKKLSGLSP